MNPKVSVALVAYRHAQYLRQAMDSVLAQKTSFPFEVVVGDDASEDGSGEILAAYVEQDPRIRVLPRPQRLGRPFNRLDVLSSCRGQYIANLDGDDWWCSPDKLQLQVELMDAHPDVSISFHALEQLRDDGSRPLQFPPGRQPFYSVEDLLSYSFITTAASMYRAGLVEEIPEWFYRMPMFDWPMNLLYALRGRIGYIDQVLGTYRWHREGVWSTIGAAEANRRTVNAYRILGPPLTDRHRETIDRARRSAARQLAARLCVAGQSREARCYAKMALWGSPRTAPGGLRGLFGLVLLAASPKLYRRARAPWA